MKKNFKELKDEELENVNGGCKTKYSSDTYAKIELSQSDLGAGQVVTNHISLLLIS